MSVRVPMIVSVERAGWVYKILSEHQKGKTLR